MWNEVILEFFIRNHKIHSNELWWVIICVNLARPWYPDARSNILDLPVKAFFLGEINI